LFRAKVAAVLRVDAAQLDPDLDLTSQGLDSLMAAQLRQEVQRAHGILLPVSKILSRTTLSELEAHLLPSPSSRHPEGSPT
jgi:aryl carrier-like protein